MDNIVKGQRVITCHGPGTVVNFEICHIGMKKAEYSDTFYRGCRVAVQLDNPGAWAGHKYSAGLPHYVPEELKPE